MSQLPSYTAPDNSVAEYDPSATRLAYNSFAGDPCGCLGCRNFRAVWDASAQMDKSFLDACRTIGIDVLKPIETVVYEVQKETGLALYTGDFLFVGKIVEGTQSEVPSPWWFSDPGPKYEEFGPVQSGIRFYTMLPWVLPESFVS